MPDNPYRDNPYQAPRDKPKGTQSRLDGPGASFLQDYQPAFEPAGHGARFLAYFVDSMLIGFVTVVPLIVVLVLLEVPDETLDSALFNLGLQAAIFGVWALYGAFFESAEGGATLGKRLAGLRVVDEAGQPISFSTALWRNVAKAFMLSLCSLLAFTVLSDQNRGLWDKVIGTRVVVA